MGEPVIIAVHRQLDVLILHRGVLTILDYFSDEDRDLNQTQGVHHIWDLSLEEVSERPFHLLPPF
jgi:hypothetical protein